MSIKREYWQALGIFTLLAIVYFYPVLFGELIGQTDFYYFISPWNQFRPDDLISMSNSALRDQSTEFLPFFLETKSQLANGLLPLWNPYIFAGTPLLANMQSALFFPLNMGHYIFDPAVGFTISSLLKLILTAFFTYIYCRKMNLSHVAGLISATVFAYAMFNVFWLNHPHTNSTLLFPLSLYYAEQFLKNCNKRTMLFFSLIITATLFSGHVEITFLIAVATGVYLLVRAVQLKVLNFKLLYMFAFSYVVACLLSALLILPFIEFLFYSATWSERAENTLPPMPLGNIISLFLGKIFVADGWIRNTNLAHSVNLYIGVVVLPLILLAIRFNFKKSLVFIVLALIAFLSVFNIVSFHSLLLLIPIVKQTPLFYFVIFWLMSASVLAGIGFDIVIKRGFNYQYLIYSVAIIIAAIVLFVLFWDGGYYLDYMQSQAMLIKHKYQLSLIAVALLLSSILLLKQYKFQNNLVAMLFVLLVFLDLSLVGHGWNPTIKKQHSFPPINDEISRFFEQTQEPFRILSLQDVLLPSTNMLIKMEEVQGYDVPVSSRYHQFFKQALKGTDYYWQYNISQYDAAVLPFLQILNVTHIITKQDDLDLSMVHDGEVKIYELPDVKKRAFMMYQSMLAKDDEEALDLTLQNKNILGNTVIIENDVIGLPPENNTINNIEFYSRTSQKIKLKVSTQEAGYLVLSQSYYPGWYAYVDDKEVEIYPADYLLQAIKVPKGSHQVRFVYQPMSFWLGLLISLLSFITVLWILTRKSNY